MAVSNFKKDSGAVEGYAYQLSPTFSGASIDIPDGVYKTIKSPSNAKFGVSINNQSVEQGGVVSLTGEKKVSAASDSISTAAPIGEVGFPATALGGNSNNGAIFANDTFVLVGSGGSIATSSDGITWGIKSPGFSQTLRAVTYGDGFFLAVGDQGMTTSSTNNGESWTNATYFSTSFRAATFGNGIFVIAGENGTLMSATTPLVFPAFTLRTSNFGSSTINGLAYGNGVFVAVGLGGRVTTSTDGITWTAVTSFTTLNLNAVSFQDGLFLIASNNPGWVFRSTDGVNWTQGGGFSVNMLAITYGKGKHVIAGGVWNGQGAIHVSTDAITWTLVTSGYGNNDFYAAAFGNDLFVIGGMVSTIRIYSDFPGIRLGATTIHSIAHGKGIFIAGNEIGRVVSSSDGVDWVIANANFGSQQVYSVYYANDVYLAGGGAGTLRTSTDTVTWSNRSAFSSVIRSITFGNGIFIVAGSGGALATSTNSISWTIRTSSFGTSTILALHYANNIYVAAGTGGRITRSVDAVTWTTAGSYVTNMHSLAYGNGLFVAGGANGALLSSPDGITWTTRVSSVTVDINSIKFTNGLFVGVTSSGAAIISTDGITWGSRPLTFAGATIGNMSTIEVVDGIVYTGGRDGIAFKNFFNFTNEEKIGLEKIAETLSVI
jgi:hypothetical protein